MEILTLFTVGLSLSIDAFALSTVYGLINYSNKRIYLVSLVTGMFHFVMPILGYLIYTYVNKYFNIDTKYILLVVLIMILVEMIKSLKEDNSNYTELNLINIFIFAFLVSIDSFTIGLGLNYITDNVLLASFIFAFMSGMFTFIGFKLGKFISSKFRNIAKYVGIIILFTVILYILCKV